MSYVAIWTDNDKLNEVETIKLEKDGLEVIHTIIKKYAKEGYDSITPEDMNRFKWAGVYEQKPRNGFFMMRVRINSGRLSAKQAEVLAKIAKDYGRGIANITTRGAIQFHWIQVENLPDIFERLKSCGLSSFEACGDCPRTIVGNPLTGVEKDEFMDTNFLVEKMNEFFVLNKDFSNLPRKFKISISSSIHNAANAQINDIGFTPATKEIEGQEEFGFHVWVGGGLSANPVLAKRLTVFVKPSQVLEVAKATCTIFRDYGYREKRGRARLKFLVEDWGVDKFQEKLLEYVDVSLGCGEDKLVDWNASYYYGVHAQKQENKKYIGINVPFGEMTDKELLELSYIAKEYGDETLRTTLSQNLIITGIDAYKVSEVLDLEVFKRLSPSPKIFLGHSVSCTGKEFCNLALVETKDRAKQIAKYLDEKLELDMPIRLHITGCPNSCGQKQIADISLQGAKIKTEKGTEDAFTIWLGGTLEGEARFAKGIGYQVLASEAHLVIEKIIIYYQENKEDGELFHQFVTRVGADSIKNRI